ncbi:hypothetical protein [Streptomyces sp. NPDC055085]
MAPMRETTTTICPHCANNVTGLNNRYACTVCGWVNHWSEGTNTLPTAEDDPDWPGNKKEAPDTRR